MSTVLITQKPKAIHSKQKGFTLIELIAVVVILAIVAGMGTQFIVSSTESYHTTQNRSLLINRSRQALEQMTRQLRGALPHSFRTLVVGSSECLEFLPVSAGGFYTSPVPDQENAAAASNTINTAGHSLEFGTAHFVAIGAMNSAELYGGAPASLASLASRSATSLTLSAPKVWFRNSINQRFYLLDRPQAFCINTTDSTLAFHQDQNVSAVSLDISSPIVLADNVAANGTAFVLSGGTEDRNTKVTLNLTFSAAGESVDFTQEVLIRNVP